MTDQSMLARPLKIHLVAGVFCSLVFLTFLLLEKYNAHLESETEKLSIVQTNFDQMIKTVDQIDLTLDKVRAVLPADYEERSNRELMFMALDEMRSVLKGADIMVSDFVENPELKEIRIPINIFVPLKTYRAMLENTGYLQSLKFPFLTINGIRIEKTESHGTAYNINSILRIPMRKFEYQARMGSDNEDE